MTVENRKALTGAVAMVAIILALIVLLGACGGSDNGDMPYPGAIGSENYAGSERSNDGQIDVDEANVIREYLNDQYEDKGYKDNTILKTSDAELNDFADKVCDALDTGRRDLMDAVIDVKADDDKQADILRLTIGTMAGAACNDTLAVYNKL